MKYRKWIGMLCATLMLCACTAKEPVKKEKKKVVSIPKPVLNTENVSAREFDSCLHFFTNQIAQNVDYINAFEFFCCQICEI